MTYIVLKPFYAKGERHRIGDMVDERCIDPCSAPRLMRCGYITEANGGTQGAILPHSGEYTDSRITIPIMEEEGIVEATMDPQGIAKIFTIMQKNVEDASKDISGLEDPDALLILGAVDSRKGIQKAVAERNGQLLEKEKDGSSEDEDLGERGGRADG